MRPVAAGAAAGADLCDEKLDSTGWGVSEAPLGEADRGGGPPDKSVFEDDFCDFLLGSCGVGIPLFNCFSTSANAQRWWLKNRVKVKESCFVVAVLKSGRNKT